MKKYHVAAGDGKGYYGVGYESYLQATELLKISQRHDPKAHIVEEEYHFTHADRIRAMSDDELADKLHQLYLIFSDEGYYDFGRLFCDGKAGCIDEDGEVHCNDDRRKACVIRWLKQPVEVSGDA